MNCPKCGLLAQRVTYGKASDYGWCWRCTTPGCSQPEGSFWPVPEKMPTWFTDEEKRQREQILKALAVPEELLGSSGSTFERMYYEVNRDLKAAQDALMGAEIRVVLAKADTQDSVGHRHPEDALRAMQNLERGIRFDEATKTLVFEGPLYLLKKREKADGV